MPNFKKIIWISWINPSIAQGGAGTYSKSVLSSLQANFPDAEVIYVHRENDGFVSPIEKIKRSVKYSSRHPMKIAFGMDISVGEKLRRITAQFPGSLVVFNGAETFGYMDFVTSGTRLHVSHNVEHLLYGERIANSTYSREVLATILREQQKYKQFELRYLSECDYATFISPDDYFAFSALITGKMPISVVVPPSFSTARDYKARAGKDGTSVAFMADFNWSPNADGIEHFISHRWKPGKSDVLHLFGKGSEKFGDRDRSIIAHGWVPDLNTVWKLSDVMIAPIYWGGGVNIKTCEAIYQGIPLVATPMAVRGIPSNIRSEITVLEDDEKWMSSIASAKSPSLKSSNYFSSKTADIRRDSETCS